MATAPTPPAPVRQPTGPEMRRIFGLLEEKFDDKVGTYNPGWSDKRVGDELDLPWAMIRDVREMAGMKMRVDPEIAALKNDLTAAAELVAGLLTRLHALEKKAA